MKRAPSTWEVKAWEAYWQAERAYDEACRMWPPGHPAIAEAYALLCEAEAACPHGRKPSRQAEARR